MIGERLMHETERSHLSTESVLATTNSILFCILKKKKSIEMNPKTNHPAYTDSESRGKKKKKFHFVSFFSFDILIL